MLKLPLLHPQMLAALGSAGHLSRVLITDGNYPHVSRVNPRAPIVWANFSPGILDVVSVLKMIADVVPIEEAIVMEPEKTGQYALAAEPPIWARFRDVLHTRAGFDQPLRPLQKPAFNEIAGSGDLCLAVATAETEIWANLILTIGVVRPRDIAP